MSVFQNTKQNSGRNSFIL